MTNKDLKVYFIGRRHGIIPLRARPWKLENQRKGELTGFNNARGIQRVYHPSKADVIFVRNVPERTSVRDLKLIEAKIGPYRKSKIIINDIKDFKNHIFKNLSFAIWQEKGLHCPEFDCLPLDESGNDSCDRINSFLNRFKKAFLRTNCESGGKGMQFLDSNSTAMDIERGVKELQATARELHSQGIEGAKVILVEYIEHEIKEKYQNLYRAFVLGDEILIVRCLTAIGKNVHGPSMHLSDFDHFIDVCKKNIPILKQEPYASQIIKAVKALNSNIGGIDFFFIKGRIVFLEHNPMWGRKHMVGDKKFHQRLIAVRNKYSKAIPDIYEYIDCVGLYQRVFEGLKNF